MRPVNRLLSKPLAAPAPSNFVCASCRTARTFSSATSRASSTPSAPPPTGLVALSCRRLISISGPDAPKFLQGVITQNILAPQSAAAGAAGTKIRDDGFYSAFLTATGRVLYDVFIYPDRRAPGGIARAPAPGESFLIEVDAAEAVRLERHIKRYKLRAKFAVRLLDADEVTVWHGWDDDGRAALDASTAGVEDFHRFVHMRDPRAPGLGWRMLRTGDSEPLVDLPRVADEEVYRVRRYLHGVAEGQSELLRESALPLEGNLDVMGGIDFRKGCYVGQELTIRTKHRGVVRKRVLPVMLYDGAEPPQQLTYDSSCALDAAAVPVDTSIGRLEKKGRSAGKWLRGVGNVGLALCRLEIMTDVVLPGETAATTYNPMDEFVMERQASAEGQEGLKVKIKAFVPDWLRQGLEQQQSGHP
ncbi:ccr4 associated factor [Gnomoniopsis smithogilvyi]|uniref:Iron-sulfur cluster assembly factor IBA57 homolog, mitochondrial n=1 Tax=Gnomoniopsis smithogilvyi TaxID=1191159 RepID=A0A9W8YVL2_9PEZI|nr:ccr4 associated factor [Gnomoniopsis smithogilvyi]